MMENPPDTESIWRVYKACKEFEQNSLKRILLLPSMQDIDCNRCLLYLYINHIILHEM